MKLFGCHTSAVIQNDFLKSERLTDIEQKHIQRARPSAKRDFEKRQTTEQKDTQRGRVSQFSGFSDSVNPHGVISGPEETEVQRDRPSIQREMKRQRFTEADIQIKERQRDRHSKRQTFNSKRGEETDIQFKERDSEKRQMLE